MSRQHLLPLLLVLVVATVPHLTRLPVWVALACMVSWGYLFTGMKRPIPLPSKRLLTILTVAAVAANVVTFGRFFGREAGVSMLTLMLALKPFETATHRDRIITIFLAFFLIIFNLFFTQSLAMALYLVVAVLVAMSVLNHLHHPEERTGPGLDGLWSQIRPPLRTTGIILLQAVPVLAVLFVLFPRLPAGLGVQDTPRSFSGLSDEMDPGSISRLVLSREPAFRAEFETAPPPREAMYWRGVTLWVYMNQKWVRGLDAEPLEGEVMGEERVDYSVILEPHGERWLYVLDTPSTRPVYGPDRRTPRGRYVAPRQAILLADRTLWLPKEIKRKHRYRASSFVRYETGPSRIDLQNGLLLPGSGDPRTRELAAQWQHEAGSDGQIAARGLEYIRSREFFYTLEAPPLPETDPVDHFLFESRRGFCEHYAGAYCFLMRAAGVPSRVVLGYMGGEYNEMGDYWIVRAMDAHAWVEVYLQGRGWVRVDPTAAVAPERVERGLLEALDQQESGRFTFNRLEERFAYLQTVRLAWDAMNYAWSRWVLDYTYENQKQFLSRFGLGFDSWKQALAAVGVGLALLLLMAGGIYWRLRSKRRAAERDKARIIYDRFCRKLARAGVKRRPDQGPLDYVSTVARRRPDLAAEAAEIAHLYARLRYGPDAAEEELAGLEQRVRRFRPKRADGRQQRTDA